MVSRAWVRFSQTRLVASIRFTESTMNCLKRLAWTRWNKPILLSHGIYAALLLCCVPAGGAGFSFSLTRRTLLLRHLGHIRSRSASSKPRHSFPQRRHLKVTCSGMTHFHSVTLTEEESLPRKAEILCSAQNDKTCYIPVTARTVFWICWI